ncbi:MAG: hypothetical protein ACOYKA_02090 [Legionellaceae bacterium]
MSKLSLKDVVGGVTISSASFFAGAGVLRCAGVNANCSEAAAIGAVGALITAGLLSHVEAPEPQSAARVSVMSLCFASNVVGALALGLNSMSVPQAVAATIIGTLVADRVLSVFDTMAEEYNRQVSAANMR